MRGDVHRLKAPRNTRGHEQAGTRYAVVVQSDNMRWSTWLVAPTSASAVAGPVRPQVMVDGRRTTVQIDQLTAVDPEHRLGDVVGYLTLAEMQAVDRALLMVLALD